MKHLNKFLMLSIILCLASTNVFAYDIAVENSDGVMIYYNNINGGLEVTKHPSFGIYYSGSVVIPDVVTFNGVTRNVIAIGFSAFDYCINLTSVTIPNSVTSIRDGAFSRCSGLTSITIPNSVTSIGNSAFKGCTSLASIEVEENNNSYVSENGVLFNKDLSTLIAYPASKSDVAYIVPNSVTTISHSAFEGCVNLKSLVIGNSVKVIYTNAFYGCNNINYIYIPNGVTSIGNFAFYGCSGLTSVTIPSSVTRIGSGAFQECSGLTSVTIPSSVTSIGNSAFDGCSGLTSVTIPSSVTSIGEYNQEIKGETNVEIIPVIA